MFTDAEKNKNLVVEHSLVLYRGAEGKLPIIVLKKMRKTSKSQKTPKEIKYMKRNQKNIFLGNIGMA